MPYRGQRAFDLLLGVPLALLALPIIVFLAVVMAVHLRAWPLFVQDRVGRGGRTFRFLKLRTLPTDTPKYADKFSLPTPSALGAVLRRAHLDELPQLFLVLTGRMSLVGPRPEMPGLHAANGNGAFANARVTVRPGCAGLWQISPAVTELIWQHPQYDTFYIAHQSLRMDAWIMWRAALLLLGVGQPVTIDQLPPLVADLRTPTPDFSLAGDSVS